MTNKQDNERKRNIIVRIKEIIIIIIGWLIPGMGHLLLKKYGRALLIFLIINFLFFFGLFGLNGRLYAKEPGNPISVFAAIGQKGVGIPFIIVKIVADKQENDYNLLDLRQTYTLKEGLPSSPYYEYGIAFTVSAGLLNLLILFDIFDIARGRKK